MSLQTWEEALYASIADATQISNTTSETIMVPDTAIPARYWYPGRTLKATLRGALSCVATTPGTLTFRARYGGVAGTLLAASAALGMNIGAKTNSQIALEFLITCRANGWSSTSGSLWTTGQANLGEARVAADVGSYDMIPLNSPSVVGALNLIDAGTLSLTAQFSVATSPTNLLINQFVLEALN